MRIGVLTGGGDCPGLNAVIRAVGRRSFSNGHEVLGIRAGLEGARGRADRAARAPRDLGDPPEGRDDHRHLADEPVQDGLGRPRARELPRGLARRARRDRGRGHARRRGPALPRAGLPGRRRAEDDRQRPRRHRLHLRLRHRRDDRDRGDRPPAHDRRVAQPRDGRRGDGPAHRLDRRDERDRRRRRRDPDPRAADHRRAGLLRDPQAPRARARLLDRRRQRGLRADLRLRASAGSSARRRARPTSSAT